jgi:hypothetical protein
LTAAERRDPAVRQYWSDRCVQQRARGWGQTADCDNPAYSGGYRPGYRDYRRGYDPWDYGPRYDDYGRYGDRRYVPPPRHSDRPRGTTGTFGGGSRTR